MLKYEDSNGNVTEIGSIDVGGGITNMLTLAVDSNGSLYNGGKGWKTGYRLNSTGGETAADGMEVTGFIPFTLGDTIYLSGITMKTGSSAPKHNTQYLIFYDENYTYISNTRLTDAMLASTLSTHTEDSDGNLTSIVLDLSGLFSYMGPNAVSAGSAAKQLYIRISAEEINDDSVITLNEPIE